MWKLLPPPPSEKIHPLFPSNHPLKAEVLSSPSFENLVGGSTPPPNPQPAERGGGGHYDTGWF